MREIKFRAKDLYGNWVYGMPIKSYWYGTESTIMIEDGKIYGGWNEAADSYEEIKPSTLGQCTGFKDKNGKLIYEGDIIGISFYSYHELEFTHTIDNVNIISFQNIVHKLQEKHNNICEIELEIIGDIHDNKELLNNE